jgi:polyisoprenoid-binding protein YceI
VQWFCSKHKGYVKFKSGKIIVVKNKIVDGYFSVAMDSITNIDIDYDLMRGTLENVLKSIDFFNIKQFPTSTFEIIHINNVKDNEYCISGNLKILSISKFINFHSEIIIVGNTLIAKSKKFTINRTEWGVTNSSKNYVKGDEAFIIPDEISFVINLTAVVE